MGDDPDIERRRRKRQAAVLQLIALGQVRPAELLARRLGEYDYFCEVQHLGDGPV